MHKQLHDVTVYVDCAHVGWRADSCSSRTVSRHMDVSLKVKEVPESPVLTESVAVATKHRCIAVITHRNFRHVSDLSTLSVIVILVNECVSRLCYDADVSLFISLYAWTVIKLNFD